jgi:hypothetical protein
MLTGVWGWVLPPKQRRFRHKGDVRLAGDGAMDEQHRLTVALGLYL